jgi:hypothetical protein
MVGEAGRLLVSHRWRRSPSFRARPRRRSSNGPMMSRQVPTTLGACRPARRLSCRRAKDHRRERSLRSRRSDAQAPWPDLPQARRGRNRQAPGACAMSSPPTGPPSDAAEEPLKSRAEYTAERVFWVTPEVRWQYLNQRAKQPEIGKLIDNAMDLIEVDNPSLRCMVRRATPGLASTSAASASSSTCSRLPGEGHPGLCLRVLPRPVRLRRGQGPRRVLHTSVRRQAGRGDAGAHEQASLRRVPRLGRSGRAGRAVR